MIHKLVVGLIGAGPRLLMATACRRDNHSVVHQIVNKATCIALAHQDIDRTNVEQAHQQSEMTVRQLEIIP